MIAIDVEYLKYTPIAENSEGISSQLNIEAEQSENHGDIIDFEKVVPFDEIPYSIKDEINERYELEIMSEEQLAEFKENFMCRGVLSLGMDKERGFEVHSSIFYYYLIGGSEEAQYTSGQGVFNKQWLGEVYDQLKKLNWKPETLKQKQHFIQMSDDLKISVLEHSENHYELAVMHKQWSGADWEIDYSIFNDVLTARTSMEVYGTIKNIMEQYTQKYPNTEFRTI